jgi:DNA polymerase sigma
MPSPADPYALANATSGTAAPSTSDSSVAPNESPLFGTDPFSLEVLETFRSLLPPAEELQAKSRLLATLVGVVRRALPTDGVRLTVYGSSANHLAGKASDVDLCLECDEAKLGDKGRIVARLGKVLESEGMKDVLALSQARVPVVKFVHPPTSIECDICVNNTLALHNTQLIRDYVIIDPRLRPLAYVVKFWAARRMINKPYEGFLSSYALVLMLINALQMANPPVLPCLQAIPPEYTREQALEFAYRHALGDVDRTERPKCPEVRVSADPVKPRATPNKGGRSKSAVSAAAAAAAARSAAAATQAEGHNVYRYPRADLLRGFGEANRGTVWDLLAHFFDVFGNRFDHDAQVASVRRGGFITKQSRGWDKGEKLNRHIIAVEDPQDLTHDLGRNVDKKTSKVILNEFKRASRLIAEGQGIYKIAESYSFAK